MEGLTVKEVAELKGCTDQYARGLVRSGKIKAHEVISTSNGRKQHIIPVSSLPDDLRQRYYEKLEKTDLKQRVPAVTEKKRKRKEVKEKPFDSYTKEEREEIMFWSEILERWQRERSVYKNATEADDSIIKSIKHEHFLKTGEKLNLSVDILYRKYLYYKDKKLGGLLDARGGWNKGKSTIPQVLWEQFLTYYLDERQPSLSYCYTIAREIAMEFYPEMVAVLPSEQSFRRRLKAEVPPAAIMYMRKGEKACFDACAPYISRMYDEIEANDVWIADNHTWDIMTMYDGKEALHRMYITGFTDAKSGAMVGWNLTDNPCSDSTIFALRHGIMRHGVPKVLYFDNGTEFLTNDIAGRGHRTRKSQRDVPKPETILKKLGIEMKNAIVRNAKAKPIERTFYTLKEHISKLFSSYCGGKPDERPESLKRQIKNGNIPTDSEFRKRVDTLIEGIYNLEDYGGSEKKYKGYTRLEVWNESIKHVKQRIAGEEDLNLLLMRSSGYQKVKRSGVFITIAGEKLWYSHQEAWKYKDNEVYLRYDPTDLKSVRLYDTEDKYLFTWELERDLQLNFIESNTLDLATASEKVAANKKAIRNYAKGLTENLPTAYRIDALDFQIRKAEAAIEGTLIEKSNIIEFVRPNIEKETSEYTMAVGDGCRHKGVVVDINLNKMNQNALKNKNK